MQPKLEKKTMFNKIIKKQLFVTISTAFLLIFILVGSSYAVLNARTETGLTDVVVQSGNLLATISSSSDMINMNYTTLGVSDEVGLGYEPYTFAVSNVGENKIAYYEIRIVDKEYEISTLPHKSLNYVLSVNGSEYTTPQNLGDNRSYIYVGGSLDIGESDTFNLKLWVNEEFGKYANDKELRASIELTLYSDMPTRNYIIYDSQGGSYIPKTNIVSKRISMQTPVKAGYSFIGWSKTPDGEVEYESNAIYNGTNGITLYALWERDEKLYDILETSLATKLTAPDVDGTRFVYGDDVDNNYVWYSGKLWRIVSLNNDGSIKLVTEGDITSISWHLTDNPFPDAYKDSQVHRWLISEFLQTINTNLIMNSVWDCTVYSTFPTSKLTPTCTITEKVGLINIYEYMMTGGAFDGADSSTFLDNETTWFTMYNWAVADLSVAIGPGGLVSGVRPSVNLISNIRIIDGNGTITEPYILNGDMEKGVKNELLNNRVSGEYIYFNNVKYRIIGTEEINNQKLTKVTMADYKGYGNKLVSQGFSGSHTFTLESDFGKYLDDWYNGLLGDYGSYYKLNDFYRQMIATADDGIVWYQGPSSGVYLDYTLSKTGLSINATIGIPYYGEMFASQYNYLYRTGTSASDILLMTLYDSSPALYKIQSGAVVPINHAIMSSLAAKLRPCMYLKNDVRIVSGAGTFSEPYEITLGEVDDNKNDVTKPSCIFSSGALHLYSNHINETMRYGDYYLFCTDESDIEDTIIDENDFEFSNNGIAYISEITKTRITKGYLYKIELTGSAEGTTIFSLKSNSLRDYKGNSNDSVTAEVIVESADATKPVCTFSGPTIGTISTNDENTTSQFILDCVDNLNIFKDSTITIDDFEFSNNGVVEISNIASESIASGYRYTITVSAIGEGTTTLTLKSAAISDYYYNQNDSATSSSITVSNVVADSTPPVCVFSGPATSTIYWMKEPRTTEFYLECTDDSDFNDSEITENDFTIGDQSIEPLADSDEDDDSSGSEPPITISSVVKSTITGGYKYTITVSAAMPGATTMSLNIGAVSDIHGNSNLSVTSASITVKAS